MKDDKMDAVIRETKKRGALLGTLEALDWFLTNGHVGLEEVHEIVKRAIRKDKDDITEN
jgi:hypothetical protein